MTLTEKLLERGETLKFNIFYGSLLCQVLIETVNQSESEEREAGGVEKISDESSRFVKVERK